MSKRIVMGLLFFFIVSLNAICGAEKYERVFWETIAPFERIKIQNSYYYLKYKNDDYGFECVFPSLGEVNRWGVVDRIPNIFMSTGLIRVEYPDEIYFVCRIFRLSNETLKSEFALETSNLKHVYFKELKENEFTLIFKQNENLTGYSKTYAINGICTSFMFLYPTKEQDKFEKICKNISDNFKPAERSPFHREEDTTYATNIMRCIIIDKAHTY